MIVKKGNKQKVLNLPIPADNKIASHHLKERELAKEQKNELKKLVLQLDQRDRLHDEDRTHKLETEVQIGMESWFCCFVSFFVHILWFVVGCGSL
jgi:hypothetical protein